MEELLNFGEALARLKDGKKVEQAADELGVKVNIDVKAVEAKYKQFIKIVNMLNNVKIRG